MNKRLIGAQAEEEAVHYLRANGYDIKERNWRWKRYEIDIIAEKDRVLVFVEVKTRKDESFGYPEEFLSIAQEDRIHQAAEAFCEQSQWLAAVRFDIIAILQNDFPKHLTHLEDAF